MPLLAGAALRAPGNDCSDKNSDKAITCCRSEPDGVVSVEPVGAAERPRIVGGSQRRDGAPADCPQAGGDFGIVAKRQEQDIARRFGGGDEVDQRVG